MSFLSSFATDYPGASLEANFFALESISKIVPSTSTKSKTIKAALSESSR